MGGPGSGKKRKDDTCINGHHAPAGTVCPQCALLYNKRWANKREKIVVWVTPEEKERLKREAGDRPLAGYVRDKLKEE